LKWLRCCSWCEVASLLLLVAIVGSVMMARKKV